MATKTKNVTRPPVQIRLPKFSVVITSHNYEKFIEQAIASVRSQSYENFECLIIDDKSTDNSIPKIKALLAKIRDSRFQLLSLPKNVGQLGAMKIALAKLSGDFVGFLDADDVLGPNFIRDHVFAHLGFDQACSFSCSDMAVISETQELLASTWVDLAKPRGRWSDKNQRFEVSPLKGAQDLFEEKESLMFYATHNWPAAWMFTPTSGCVFRKAILDEIMPDDTNLFKISADYYLVMFASLLTGALVLTKPLSFYRLHGKNNYSTHPFFGCNFSTGPWDEGKADLYKKAILFHLNSKFDRFAAIFGAWRCVELVQKLVPKNRTYALLHDLNRLRVAAFPGPKFIFWFLYGVFYRWKQ